MKLNEGNEHRKRTSELLIKKHTFTFLLRSVLVCSCSSSAVRSGAAVRLLSFQTEGVITLGSENLLHQCQVLLYIYSPQAERFQVLTAWSVKMAVRWVLAPCSLAKLHNDLHSLQTLLFTKKY
jgi:hypothetical protein